MTFDNIYFEWPANTIKKNWNIKTNIYSRVPFKWLSWLFFTEFVKQSNAISVPNVFWAPVNLYRKNDMSYWYAKLDCDDCIHSQWGNEFHVWFKHILVWICWRRFGLRNVMQSQIVSAIRKKRIQQVRYAGSAIKSLAD